MLHRDINNCDPKPAGGQLPLASCIWGISIPDHPELSIPSDSRDIGNKRHQPCHLPSTYIIRCARSLKAIPHKARVGWIRSFELIVLVVDNRIVKIQWIAQQAVCGWLWAIH